MNFIRIGLAGLAATVAYFLMGAIAFGVVPQVRNEFRKYPAVYRTQEDIKTVMPVGMIAMFVSIVGLAALYALACQGGSGIGEGARFGALIGVFSTGAFVLHNYVNLNIGVKITAEQGLAYFVLWIIVGVVIGMVYKPVSH